MKANERIAVLSGAFFLFGLAWLVWMGAIWPVILLLILLTGLPILLVEEGLAMTLWLGAQMTVWLAGLPLLIRAGRVWPGVLILAGISAVILALVNPDDLQKKHKAKRDGHVDSYSGKYKRGIPVPPGLNDDNELYNSVYGDVDEDDWDDEDQDQPSSVRRTGRR